MIVTSYTLKSMVGISKSDENCWIESVVSAAGAKDASGEKDAG